MLKKKIKRILCLMLVLCFVFPTTALAATGDPQTVQYLYFQDSSAQMVIVDFIKAINDAINGDLVLYNSIKDNLGAAILSGAPVYLETTVGIVLDYQKAITDNKPDLIQIQDDPLYQTSKPAYSFELKVVGGVAVIVPITVPGAPAVTNDDTANAVSGMILGYEYSLDGTPYVLYNAITFSAIDFSGNHTLLVRVAATGIVPAGNITTLLFTTNSSIPAAPPVTRNDVTDTVTGMTNAMEYNYDGMGYVMYDPFDIAFASLNFHGEHTLLVRYAAVGVTPASLVTTLTFTTAPGPNVTNNDTTNTVTGMTTLMEYKIDGAGYVAYNAIAFAALDFSGNHTLLVRFKADPFLGFPPSLDTTLTFTANPGPDVTNDDIANTVTGMTTGMEYNLDGAGYVAYNAIVFAAIDFSGNHMLLVRIASDGINPAGPAATLIFTTNPVVPAAPPVTNNDVTDEVFGMTSAMEYNYDGEGYVMYDPFDIAFASLNFHGEHTLLVRYAAVGITPASLVTTLTFTTAPGPNVTNDDTANTVTGMTTLMEYNLDGSGYVAYDAIAFAAIDFSGNHTLLVRFAADPFLGYPPSLDTTLTFTINQVIPAAPPVTNNDVTDTVFGMTSAMEYNYDGAGYVMYDPFDIAFASLNFHGEHALLVRYAAVGATPASLVTTLTFTTAPGPNVTNDDTANTVTGMTTLMEYKLDGSGYVAYDAIAFAVIDFSGNHTLLVRFAADPFLGYPPSLDTTLTFTINPEPPAAPPVTNNDVTDTVFGMTNAMEYNYDGMGYVMYNQFDIAFASLNFHGEHTLLVRYAAVGATPASLVTTLTFTIAPGPNVTNNDTTNTVTGMTTLMEYKLDGAGYVAYNALAFGALDLSGNHTLLVRFKADPFLGFPPSLDTTLNFTSSTIVNAEAAVSAYELAQITNLSLISVAEALKVPADIAVALVTDPVAKAAFEVRITLRTAQIATTKANLIENEIAVQAIAEVAVANLEATPLANIANVNTAVGLKITADAKVLLVGDSIAKAAFQQRINVKFIAMAIVELDLQTFAPSYESYMAKYVTVLGIDFTDYNALADKLPVHNAMVAATFTTISDIQTTFNNAVASAKASEISIVTAFNSAVDAVAIGTAITTYAPSISLTLTEYNAIINKTPVHTELLGRNFTSGDQVKTAIIVAIINNSTAVNIGNVLNTNATYLGLQTISEFSYIRTAMQNAVFASKPIADKTQLVVIAVSSSTQYYLGQMLPYFKDIMGLDLTDYNALAYRGKVNVQNDLVALTFVTKADVQNAYTTSVLNRKMSEATALAMFNNATTAEEIGLAITAAVTTNLVIYDNTDYSALSNKVPVQNNLLIPTFDSMTQVEVAISNATSTQKLFEITAMANINNANTASDMDIAIMTSSATLGWNLTDYNALSSKLSVQNMMLSQTFFSLFTMKTTFDTAVTTQKAVDAINNADATTMGAVITSNSAILGLTAASVADYNSLVAGDKDSVHVALVGKAFIDKAAIKIAFEAAVGVPHINAVTTPASMGLAITRYASALGISIVQYNTLAPANKIAVHNAMLTPVFLNALEIKTAFDAAVAIESVNAAVAAMNSAPNTTFMATYITTYATTLGLDLIDYNTLTNKVPVQTALLTPVFVTASDVKTAFDTAVAVAKVNEATLQTIGAVLTSNANKLGLVLTDYTALINKESVHNSMLTPVFTTAATVKTDFDIAVAIQKAIEDPVSEIPSVVLNKSITNLIVGTNETLIATVLPASAPNKAVIWSSDNDAVATVDSNGLVTGTGGGTAIITVTTVVGGYTDTCTVDVIVPVTGVVLNKSETSLLIGMADTLFATVQPTSATNKNLVWSVASSSNSATVNNGIVTGAAVGIATITVRTVDGNFSATCFVTVTTEAVVLNNFNLATSTYMPGFIIQYANVIGLDLTNYHALDAYSQTQVQNALMVETFTTLAQIKAVFDESMLLLTLNAATMDTMNSVITNNANALGLDLTAYALLPPANQEIVHGYLLLTMYNYGGFYTASDFKITFDLAVTDAPAANIALAEINAATVGDIGPAIINNGILLSQYLDDYVLYPDQVAMNTALAAQDFSNPYELQLAINAIVYP